jgi:prepilin-type N-terminal cleavage/methylation domain-containing protein
MKQADRPGRRGSRAAFTLVEMLVVIAILGILMAMMVPAAGLILKRAKRATAQADAGVVVSVLLKYYSEYNRWPEFYTSTPGTDHFTDNVWVGAMSPDPTTGTPGVFNFKNIRFFEPSGGSLQTDPAKPFRGVHRSVGQSLHVPVGSGPGRPDSASGRKQEHPGAGDCVVGGAGRRLHLPRRA